MSATLWLQFENRAGETTVRPRRQQPPWRVIRAFPTPAGEALMHLHNVSGGVLDRDDLRLRIDVAPHARAQVTTTGATRVYRSRSPEAVARQLTELNAREHSFLEYLPDPLIPYGRSRFQQSTTIDLGEQALLFWWETIACGREAMGEVFAFESLAASVELRAAGDPIATERFVLDPAFRDPRSPARLGPFRYFSTFYICQPGRAAGSWLDLESQLASLAAGLSRPDEVLWGVSALGRCGLVVRGVARKGRDLTGNLTAFWRMAKWELCARAATVPRKIR